MMSFFDTSLSMKAANLSQAQSFHQNKTENTTIYLTAVHYAGHHAVKTYDTIQ